MNVTKLVPESAQQAHKEILLSLGSENNPRQWMEFCETIDKHIPEMSTKGRMSNKEIKQSLIGKLGFDSFKSYIETDIDQGGLGWSSGGWNAYRRAWSLVKKYPYLRDLPIKSGWLNAFANQCRKAEIDFPETLEAYNEIQESKLEARENNKDAKLDDQAKRIIELEELLENKTKELEENKRKSEIVFTEQRAKIETLEKMTEQLSNKVEPQATKIAELEEKLRKKPEVKKVKVKLTRLEALRVAVFGN